MDKVQKQRGSIVLHKETRDGADYIRVEYANSQAVARLLAQDPGMEMAGNGSAYIASAAFSLPDFYDRYSPHAYIDYSRVYVRHPKPKREYTLPKGYLELLEQKRYSPSTVKTYRAYFSDFMEYHKGRNIDRLKVPDINKYILYLVNEKKISVSQQNMRINAIKFYYEQVNGGKRQYYGGITRAKEYKSLPEVLSKNEIKRILAQISNIKHHCMISLVYSAGLRRSELLNLTPQDINSETMSVRIMGKGKKCRYSLLSPKLLEELRHYFREYRPQKWLFEGETPGEQYSASALVKVLKEAAHRAGIKHRVHVHMLRHSFATLATITSTNMERISIQSDSPGYIKVSEIGKELIAFSEIIEKKYNQIDFELAFCFRALYTTQGINSKVRFYKDENWLGMDLIMPVDEFNPYKNNISMQRRIMGKYFFPFFSVNIHKYIYKLPILKVIEKDLVEDMRLFLIENLWLPDENGQYKLSVIETVSYERSIELLGNPIAKRFAYNEQGIKVQYLTWIIDDAKSELSATYLLIDKKWQLQKYQVRIKEVANNAG